MPKLTKTDIPNYFKSEDGTVLNTNNAELDQYLENRRIIQKQKNSESRFQNLEKEVEGLNSKLDLILEKLK